LLSFHTRCSGGFGINFLQCFGGMLADAFIFIMKAVQESGHRFPCIVAKFAKSILI